MSDQDIEMAVDAICRDAEVAKPWFFQAHQDRRCRARLVRG